MSRSPVALAYAGFVVIGLSSGVGGVLLLAQMADYAVDRATIGITFFTFSAGFLLASFTVGGLLQRLGSRLALTTGGALFVVAALAVAGHPPFVALVAIQLLIGYACGVLESVLNAYLLELPGATARLNRLHAFFGVGALLGPLLATWILGYAAWPVVWLVLALVCAPLTVGFLVVYPRRIRTAIPEPVAGRLLRSALRQRAVMLAAVLLSVYVGLEIGVGSWGFGYLVQERGLPEILAGYAISGYWLGLTVGRFVISPIALRLGANDIGMMYACLAGITAAAALIWLVPAASAAGLAVLGFFLGPVFPTTMAVTPQLTAAGMVPTAIGVLNAGSVVGGSGLPWLAGAIGQGIGVWTLLPFTMLLGLIQLGVWWRLVRRIQAPAAVAEAAA